MTITFTLYTATEAFSADYAAEVTAIVERVGELVLEMAREGEDITADLFDTDGDKVGTIRITENEAMADVHHAKAGVA
jgi:hypothetical protein